MVHTLLIVAAGWLALDVLIFAFLFLAGSMRKRRAGPQRDITQDLLAACPIRREPEPVAITARARTRFRPSGEPATAEVPPADSSWAAREREV